MLLKGCKGSKSSFKSSYRIEIPDSQTFNTDINRDRFTRNIRCSGEYTESNSCKYKTTIAKCAWNFSIAVYTLKPLRSLVFRTYQLKGVHFQK
eukprot:c32577_g1_i1 orf=79-357(+)